MCRKPSSPPKFHSAEKPLRFCRSDFVNTEAFTKVKELIDKMVAELTKQQADEVDHRDFCIAAWRLSTGFELAYVNISCL